MIRRSGGDNGPSNIKSWSLALLLLSHDEGECVNLCYARDW